MHLRHVMLHCFKKGCVAETVSEISAVYSDRVTVQIVRNWFRKFIARKFSLEDRKVASHLSRI